MRSKFPATMVLSFALGAFFPSGLHGADISIHVPPVSGEPGEEVAIEFWADSLAEPMAFVNFQFDLDRSAAEFIRTEIEGTASAGAPPRGVISDPECMDVTGPCYCAGVYFSQQGSSAALPPGKDILILKAILRILPDAIEGTYPLVRSVRRQPGLRVSSVRRDGGGRPRSRPRLGPLPLFRVTSGRFATLLEKKSEAVEAAFLNKEAFP